MYAYECHLFHDSLATGQCSEIQHLSFLFPSRFPPFRVQEQMVELCEACVTAAVEVRHFDFLPANAEATGPHGALRSGHEED